MITSLIALLMAICVLAFMFTIYYVFGAETTNGNDIMTEYVQEIKFDTCHTILDIYNLTNYYNCIGI
jgi:hypothetical protein